MATTIELKGSVRTETGKGVARKLRRNNLIPCVLYGRGRDPLLLALDGKGFVRTLTGHSASNLIVDLKVDKDGDPVKTLIREIQTDPVTGEVLHVDLNQILLTDTIEIEVPVELEGLAIGVKNSGGILQHPVRTLAIKCLPHNMPDKIRIDVSRLEIGESIHVSEIQLEDVEILTDPGLSLATVSLPTKIEEPTVEAEVEAVEGAEPELVGKEEGEKEGEKEGKKEGKKEEGKEKGKEKGGN